MVTLTIHVITWPDLHCTGPLALGDFCNIFLPNISEDQKKSYLLNTGPWLCVIWQIRRWFLHYVHKKFRWGPEVAIFRTKTLDFILVIRLNWLEEIELRGCRAPWWSILFKVNCCCMRVLLYAKMLKETENEETRIFVKFLSLVAFQLKGPGPPGPPPLRLRL